MRRNSFFLEFIFAVSSSMDDGFDELILNALSACPGPVFRSQALKTLKFVVIVCHHNRIESQCMSGDHGAKCSDRSMSAKK